jgi:hypothetical protein
MISANLSNSLMIIDLGLGALVGPQRCIDIALKMLERWRGVSATWWSRPTAGAFHLVAD